MKRRPKIGEHVIYCDPSGNDHDALCTADWGRCINVVYVSDDANKLDQYGRQIERNATSVSDADAGAAHGRYWRFPDEPRNEYKPPVAA